ncbi:protein-ADP-ribose hydrolase [Clostridium vitabionis]|jgi:O-acetyl-ADP-ribose deacetylase (regulator of RNase III)|uniref:protein-ADP-ribose hydrolase n=1 Tax=Clostridium vitabionis TaxID=2784388 RepID=UPI00188C48E2|nr:protein-ADP-ribose hydrolase [Clostridium vitabionis]
MTQQEKIKYLIQVLQNEMPEYAKYSIPEDAASRWELLRALFNVRPPYPASEEFLKIQDEVLTQIAKDKGITRIETLQPSRIDSRLYVWQGDITTIEVDAAVNAANNQMEGCWKIGHTCVDNNFHSFAGVQMRCECHRQMEELRKLHGPDYVQPTAVPMITPGYNLPAKNVIHIVGPIVYPFLTQEHQDQLAECYRASLQMASDNQCESIAFCCISTGVFMFPQDKACEIAVKTVRGWLDQHPDTTVKKVVFNVYKDEDLRLYDARLNKKIRI